MEGITNFGKPGSTWGNSFTPYFSKGNRAVNKAPINIIRIGIGIFLFILFTTRIMTRVLIPNTKDKPLKSGNSLII